MCIARYDELVTAKLISCSAQKNTANQLEENNLEQLQLEHDYWLSREGASITSRASRDADNLDNGRTEKKDAPDAAPSPQHK